jgi:large subunit ribosomal protein L6
MSRIGKQPIPIPSGVDAKLDGSKVRIKGPKGLLERSFHPEMTIEREGDELHVRRPSDEQRHRALHGLTRALLANMVQGVHEGYSKTLDLVGTGYRADQQGKDLVLNVGFSHPVDVPAPQGIEFQVEDRGKRIIVTGIDKELVGQVSVNIRRVRPPEPYKGKGIRYAGEHITMKAGKAGKARA